MIKRIEFEEYYKKINNEKTEKTVLGESLNEISKLGALFSVYRVRLSHELAQIKDKIDENFILFTQPESEEKKSMPLTKAIKAAEVKVNQENGVSRREMQYLIESIDSISFSCSTRIKSLQKEGGFSHNTDNPIQ